ncbi:MAG: phosphoribosylformylglycinamidine synthase I [Desulfobacterales bacterium]|nr:phosphoribosylformylglycinamidine synthase I [Desulfobacterales bacterium]
MPSGNTNNKVKALVLTGYGLNCDVETAHACELAGARARCVHINDVISGEVPLEDFQIMVFIGGFSWGDDHGAGVIQAVRMKKNAGERLLKFIDSGNLVIGICNGFQTLVNLGLLPGFDGNYQDRSVALTHNDCGNFRDDWVHLRINENNPCVFTRGIEHIELPVRHGEGKFIADEAVIERLVRQNQVVCRYAVASGKPAEGRFPVNPNGSIHDIAGICDPTGRVFGLMPHPEAYNHPLNHPDWPLVKQASARGQISHTHNFVTGIHIFENAVQYFQ